MEIFILGGLLVALMIYVSTRIKKSAAAAFESETVETDEFVLTKPEGFLSPLKEESEYAFEAFSKEFGKGDADKFYQARVFVRLLPNAKLAEVCRATKKTAGRILSEESFENACLIRSEETLETTTAYNFYKIIEGEKNRSIGELKISVLKDFLPEYQTRVDEMQNSFWLK